MLDWEIAAAVVSSQISFVCLSLYLLRPKSKIVVNKSSYGWKMYLANNGRTFLKVEQIQCDMPSIRDIYQINYTINRKVDLYVDPKSSLEVMKLPSNAIYWYLPVNVVITSQFWKYVKIKDTGTLYLNDEGGVFLLNAKKTYHITLKK